MDDDELESLIEECDAAYADIDQRRAEYDEVREKLAEAREMIAEVNAGLDQSARDLAAAYAALDAESADVRARLDEALKAREGE